MDSQSPPSGAQDGLEKTEFYDIHSPEKDTRERSPRGRNPRSRSLAPSMPRSDSESRAEPMAKRPVNVPVVGHVGQADVVDASGAISINSSENASIITSLNVSPGETPQRQSQGGQEVTGRNESKTPPRVRRAPTPNGEAQSAEPGRSSKDPSPRRNMSRVFKEEQKEGKWPIGVPQDRSTERGRPQKKQGQSDGTGGYAHAHHSKPASSRSSMGGRSHRSNSSGHLTNRSATPCWNQKISCADYSEGMCPGNQGQRDAAGNPVPCQRATCRVCATSCSLDGCNVTWLCEECVPSCNHKCGRDALLKMRNEMKEESEADNKKKLEEQAAVFREQLNVITAASQQSRDSSNDVMNALQARLVSTVALSEDLQRTKDLQYQTLSEAQAAAVKHMEEQTRIFNDKLAYQDKEQQRKAAEDKQAMETKALKWNKQLEK